MENTSIEIKSIWEETCRIRFGAIDRSDRLTLASVFNLFQEAAISHAENLGVGRDSMSRTGQAWVLSRMSVQVDRRPMYGETVTVRTWPRGPEKLFALRDYDIRDAQDIPAVRARSCWLVVDLEKRRPLRPQAALETIPLNEGVDALPSGAIGLSERPNLLKKTERAAAYSDLDYNGHVTNVSYIQWIQDALDAPFLENASKMRLDINYLNEVFPGQTVEIWSAPFADDGGLPDASGHNVFAFEGRKTAENGQIAFRAELRLMQ
jgi:acyl-ACP thioesterase